jgi:hypothetical protein
MKVESTDLEYFKLQLQCLFCWTKQNMKTVTQEIRFPDPNNSGSYQTPCKSIVHEQKRRCMTDETRDRPCGQT